MAKKSLINLSLDADFLEHIKKQAKARNFDKLSDYVQDWFKKLGLEKTNIKRIILQVPENAFTNKKFLETWLTGRCLEIVNHYFKETDVK